MYNLNKIPTTDYNDFFQKVYFISIIKNIIKIADLEDTKKTILDFGCGQKILSTRINRLDSQKIYLNAGVVRINYLRTN